MSPTRTILLGLIGLLLAALLIFPATADLPSSYDPRPLDLTPAIKDQGSYGICWAYASISSLESSMIHQDPDKYAGIDLSPFHLAYFTYNRENISNLSSPLLRLEGIAGDFTIAPDWDIIDNIRGLTVGGLEYQGKYALASGIGAVNESAVPYYSHGNNTPISPDLAVSKNEILLDAAFFIPFNETDAIKTHLMQSGAGILGFNITTDKPYLYQMDSGDWAYYLGSTDHDTLSDLGGHAVTLIGWDDTFASFGMKPEKNGAWLTQNSWGADPGNCTNIWIAYSEPSLTGPVFYVGGEAAYDHNYQYDGGALMNDHPTNQTTVKIANMFTAGGDELIRTVSLDTNQSVSYIVSIYTDPEGSPDAGKLSAEQSGGISYAGYYTIDLDEPVPIEKGQNFSVVYLLETDGPLNISIDSSIVDEDVETVTFAKAGQSYLNNGTGWTDMSADGITNLRIKAFTNDTVFLIGVDPVHASLHKRDVLITGTTTFAEGGLLNVTIFLPDGQSLTQQTVVMNGENGNTWEVKFSPVKLFEKEYLVTAERNTVLGEIGFVPRGFAGLLPGWK
ncbi:MAG TPA: lectin like domain-containing protein [Methanocorpusculum sp.]|nr:lectin like domain-containing protein [Methanocorpusculum sp.]